MREKGEVSDFRNPRGRYKFDGRPDGPLYDFFFSLLPSCTRGTDQDACWKLSLLKKRLKEFLIRPRKNGPKQHESYVSIDGCKEET